MVIKQIKRTSAILSALIAIQVHIRMPNSALQPATPKPYFLYLLYVFLGIFVLSYLLSFFIKPVAEKLDEKGPLLAGGVLLLNIINIVCSKLALLPVLFFPSLDRVFGVYVNDWELLLKCIASSGKLLLIGYSIGALIGFGTGMLVGFNKKAASCSRGKYCY